MNQWHRRTAAVRAQRARRPRTPPPHTTLRGRSRDDTRPAQSGAGGSKKTETEKDTHGIYVQRRPAPATRATHTPPTLRRDGAWRKPHTRTHTLETSRVTKAIHTLLYDSKTGGAGWISLRGWAPSGAHAAGSLAASERCLRPTTPSAMCTASECRPPPC